MNTVWIVMPILIVLMFLLGLELRRKSFYDVAHNPRGLFAGITGQIILLPAVAFALAWILDLPPVYFMGVMLIACCPGGSSSNIFSLLAGGDVALSVTLTAASSVITLFTLPLIMSFAALFVSHETGLAIELPVGKLLVQNVALVFLPMAVGAVFRHYMPVAAAKTSKVLGKAAFPMLMTLAGLFFLQYPQEIIGNFSTLGIVCTLLITGTMICSAILSRISGTNTASRRTIIIEVGMQNAAQAIAIASSPFIFNSGEMAIPAIIYALMMNVILLIYVFVVKRSGKAVA
ncbi:MAG: bile acid:sodium symporter family protein [Bacteroidaceae bacterium]|nr:bile acid:sodium symporter family protein [Bacteroidaceae bacterium]